MAPNTDATDEIDPQSTETGMLIDLFDAAGLSHGEAETYVMREVEGLDRQTAADQLDKAPSTVDSLLSRAKHKIKTMQAALDQAGHRLPAISSIDTRAFAGHGDDPAVEIWFANDTALRYVWDDSRDEIRKQTYVDGVVHDDYGVGGSREAVMEYALESVAEYVQNYRDDPDACQTDWPHVYEMLVSGN